MSSRRSVILADSLLQLRQRLDRLLPKSPERATQIAATAQLYGISVTTDYHGHCCKVSDASGSGRATTGLPEFMDQTALYSPLRIQMDSRPVMLVPVTAAMNVKSLAKCFHRVLHS